jgi:hypothetical protein
MKKLLDVTDRRVRLLQHVALLTSTILLVGGIASWDWGAVPRIASVAGVLVGALFVTLTAGIKQRWEIEYKGHRIRFENSAVTAEKLYIDEGLVARGGIGFKMELRAPIRVGDGAGEEIMVLADAGFIDFRVRMFVEGIDDNSVASVPPRPASTTLRGDSYGTVPTDLRPVLKSSVVGKLTLANRVFEAISAIVALIGAAGSAILWLLR